MSRGFREDPIRSDNIGGSVNKEKICGEQLYYVQL